MYRKSFMKRNMLLICMLAGAQMACAMSEKASKILAGPIFQTLKTLQAEADDGKLDSSLALNDFKDQLNDPEHKISDYSQGVLKSLGLIDDKGNILPEIRQVLNSKL